MSPSTADILREAIPLIQAYAGEYVVYKIGGHVFDDESGEHLENFAKDILSMHRAKIKTVIVHGGSTQIKRTLDKMGIESRFKNGFRITDAPTMEVVEMVLSGFLNKKIVDAINQAGGKAIGISGKDGNLLKVKPVKDQDLGFVAEPIQQRRISYSYKDPENIKILKKLEPSIILDRERSFSYRTSRGNRIEREGFIPVISPVSSFEGKTYNVNADWAASVIARDLGAKRLFFHTDVDGLLDKNGNLIEEIDSEEAKQRLQEQDTIKGGMRVKLEASIAAVENGVKAAVFLNGKRPNVSLLESFTKKGAGTLIKA